MTTQDGAVCAAEQVPDVVLDDDAGPLLIVGGLRIPVDAARLRFLSRRAAAVAAALEGIPDGPEVPVYERPFARVGMPRLPIEAGIPDDLMTSDLPPARKLVWIQAWREVPHLLGRTIWQGRYARLGKTLHVLEATVRQSFDDLAAYGFATILGRAPRPSGYGENAVELHLERRPTASAAGVIETTAEPREPKT
jgi:hypothetical protein